MRCAFASIRARSITIQMSGIKSKEIEGCVGVVQSGMKELRRSSLSLGWEGEKDVAEK